MMYAVLADDLTGAADAGVEFAQAGWRTRILRQDWQAPDLKAAKRDQMQVVVIDTASRACDAASASARVQRAARLVQAGAGIVFKKIDSTLRGPVGAELDALLDVLRGGGPLAIVCPAFPAAGRTLLGGVLYVDGVPASLGAAGRDPITPLQESHLPTLLRSQSQRPVAHFPRPSRNGAGEDSASADGAPAGSGLAAQWRAQLPQGGLAVVDALDDGDLALIVQAALADPQPLLLAGSAGLARPLAASLAQAKRGGSQLAATASPPAPATPANPHRVGRASSPTWLADAAGKVVGLLARPTGSMAQDVGAPVLIVCGSLHPVARAQVRALQTQLAGDAFALLATPEERTPARPAATDALQQVALALAQTAAAWLQTHATAGVVVTGGDTLESLLAALDARGLDLAQALAPGVPLGYVAGGPWAGLRIVSKAGGFGATDTLVQAVRYLSGA